MESCNSLHSNRPRPTVCAQLGGKGSTREKDCTSVFGASVSNKGFNANMSGKGIPNNKGFRSHTNGKSLTQQRASRSVFGASATSKGFSANKIGKRISVDAGGNPSDEEITVSKDKIMYVLNCKMNIDIVAITQPVDSARRSYPRVGPYVDCFRTETLYSMT